MLTIVIFEGIGDLKKRNSFAMEFCEYFGIFIFILKWGFIISDDEQSKLESSSSSFDNYYPEIAKVIYIVNVNLGYKIVNVS